MGETIVEARHLSHRYATQWAIQDINFEISQRGILGLLGSNGAGKSTTMNIICGVLNQTEGEVFINGINLRTDPVEAKKYIGFLPQRPPLYPELSVDEYLTYCARLRLMDAREIRQAVDTAEAKCGITHFKKRLIGNLSGGYQQRVGIAQAMLNDPKILILDEPTAGLDPKERARFRNILSTLSKNRIVILSTHIVSDIESNANQVILLKERKLYRMDTVSNICKTLDGKVYECVMEDRAFDAFQDTHLILSVRQEQEHMQVRYYSSKPEEGSRNCAPNLEDVFLVTYQEEPA